MEEETTEVATDTNVEVEEDTNISTEDETSESTEDSEALQAKLDDALKAKSELTARAKRAEEENKALKATQEDNKPNDPMDSDELRLIARGLSDEAIDKAKIIAKGNDISLQEALKDDMFISYQAKVAEDVKKEKAKLGASKGSGETVEAVKGTESGSSRDDHQKAFNEKLGKK
ncbi:MAG TPA: hypothetical protein ENG81_01045 [Candidatus Bathyarchaeota archaeon]|nr:hypothetical protein [Candidatus Bathyarchaeota archaeon]